MIAENPMSANSTSQQAPSQPQSKMVRDFVKWKLFPGLNLHARLRNQLVPGYF